MNTIAYENYQEKKDHVEQDFPYTVYPCTIPLDFPKVPLHWHDEMELIYVKKGEGTVEINYVIHHVKAGDILIILPGKLHSIDQKPGCSMEYENIIFQYQMLLPRQPDICTIQYFMPLLLNQITIPEHLPAPEHPELLQNSPKSDCRRSPTVPPSDASCLPDCTGCESALYHHAASCLDRADQLSRTKPPAYQLAIKAQLMEFFFALFSNPQIQKPAKHDMSGTASPHSLEKIKIILKYVETHYQEKITIQDMAEACGFSQSHFMKFFKLSFGRSFITYLKEYRLLIATQLLLTTDTSILEIAVKTGFDNLSYFNRSFKERYGQTPRDFRAHKGQQTVTQSPASS